MKKSDAIKFFGSSAAVARALRIRRQAVDQWIEIPSDKQFLLALASGAELVGGSLKVDKSLLRSCQPQSNRAA